MRDHVLGDVPWLAADPVLAPWSDPETVVHTTGAWLRQGTPSPLPPELDAFLDAGPPPVYVGFGSMAGAAEDGRAALDAARDLGRRAVVDRGWAGLAPAPADDLLVVDDVDHRALLPRVAVAVHHGGAGTTTAAALAGVPQVLVPQQYDQYHWARRVSELGIGTEVSRHAASVASLTAALDAASDRVTVERAADVASRVRTDGALVAAEAVVATASAAG
ncbi:glycosyltransferase [Actinomarinicola tropica]|uniref:glycosyltransferase n=1 Tax=Actinomarinicola tropica TaxID=2789776 RepID=UPI002B4BA369|nr:nucleotide disphospho-sugar-binding domain-containing protein [Actinomarinicola tropica]